MKKLNQEGWGLSTFLSFIAIIFIAILLVAHLSNKYGMGPTGTDNSSKGNEFLEKYQNYETIVKESSVKYQESHYPNIDNGDTFYVNINKLSVEEKILEEYIDCLFMILYFCNITDVSLNEDFIEENDRNVVEVFLKLYEYGTDLNKELDKEVIKKLLVEILYLSKIFGFTLEDLKKETKRKSLVIQKRLNSDY